MFKCSSQSFVLFENKDYSVTTTYKYFPTITSPSVILLAAITVRKRCTRS